MDSIERIMHAAVKRVVAENPRSSGSQLREALAAADPFSRLRDPAMKVIWESYIAEYLHDALREPARAPGHPVVSVRCAGVAEL
jgi:hypothetical protein